MANALTSLNAMWRAVPQASRSTFMRSHGAILSKYWLPFLASPITSLRASLKWQ